MCSILKSAKNVGKNKRYTWKKVKKVHSDHHGSNK